MFGSQIKISGGMERWFSGLAKGMGKRVRKPLRKGDGAAQRPDPVTKGEKALYEAMGWAGEIED
jgi:hypothetical protein